MAGILSLLMAAQRGAREPSPLQRLLGQLPPPDTGFTPTDDTMRLGTIADPATEQRPQVLATPGRPQLPQTYVTPGRQQLPQTLVHPPSEQLPGTFAKKKEKPKEPEPGGLYYNPLIPIMEEKLPETFTGEQLKGVMAEGPKEALEYTKIPLVDPREQGMRREEVKGLMEERAPRIKEHMLGGKYKMTMPDLEALKPTTKERNLVNLAFDNGADVVVTPDGKLGVSHKNGVLFEEGLVNHPDFTVEAKEAFAKLKTSLERRGVLGKQLEEMKPVLHETHKLPGGEDYRELVLELEGAEDKPLKARRMTEEDVQRSSLPDAEVGDWMLEGEADIRAEGTLTRQQAEAEMRDTFEGLTGKGATTAFTHPHYPDIKNPLLHLRFDKRKDTTGSDVLFMEELQSDWHQAARKAREEELDRIGEETYYKENPRIDPKASQVDWGAEYKTDEGPAYSTVGGTGGAGRANLIFMDGRWWLQDHGGAGDLKAPDYVESATLAKEWAEAEMKKARSKTLRPRTHLGGYFPRKDRKNRGKTMLPFGTEHLDAMERADKAAAERVPRDFGYGQRQRPATEAELELPHNAEIRRMTREDIEHGMHDFRIGDISEGDWGLFLPDGHIQDFVPGTHPEHGARQAFIENMVDAGVMEGAGGGSVPDAPFKRSWQELGIRRLIRHAAENGIDTVAWTTGEDQVRRYGAGSSYENEGLAKFYDEVLPRVAEKVIRKYGGKVEAIEVLIEDKSPIGSYYVTDSEGAMHKTGIRTPEEADEVAEKLLDEGYRPIVKRKTKTLKEKHKFKGFKITPAMKKEILEKGIPLSQIMKEEQYG